MLHQLPNALVKAGLVLVALQLAGGLLGFLALGLGSSVILAP